MNLLKTAIFFEFISVNNKNNGFENNVINVKKATYTLEKGQFRKTGNLGYTRHRTNRNKLHNTER